jgi:hypothetical protein
MMVGWANLGETSERTIKKGTIRSLINQFEKAAIF